MKIRLAQAAFRTGAAHGVRSTRTIFRRTLQACAGCAPRKPFVPLFCLVQNPSPAKSSENKAITLGANRRRPGSGKQSRRELKLLYCSIPWEDVLLSRNIIPLLALASLVAAPARGFAEELRQVFQQDLSDFSHTTLTPPQWAQP